MRFIDGLGRANEVAAFTFEGERLTGWAGEAIASAVMRAGILTLRHTRTGGGSRGYYCGMGLCWDCAVYVEGQGVVRSCAFPISEGLVVSYADGRHLR